MKKFRASMLLATLAALVYAGSAAAHAHVSPEVALSKTDQLFTLAVPTEKEGLTTTGVELTPPSGFAIDSFVSSPGWKREVQESGSGEDVEITSVWWTGGSVPHEEDAVFQFVGSDDTTNTQSFKVRQTYSDGSVVDWAGPESSDTPAPQVEFKSSLGGGSSDTLAIVGIVLGAVALLVAVAGLLTGSGRRPLA